MLHWYKLLILCCILYVYADARDYDAELAAETDYGAGAIFSKRFALPTCRLASGYTKTYRATGLYRALRCSVIGRWAGFIRMAMINTDYRIPDDDTEA